ncbi:MAG: hypothetical protein K2N35_08450 [Muribaculaceae bacterium]|nr:hypothetical protein [Muribaculaceae bacterium]
MDLLISQLNFHSIENEPGFEAHVAFTTSSATVFRGGDNLMPYGIMVLCSSLRKMRHFPPANFSMPRFATVQDFKEASETILNDVEDLQLDNNRAYYLLNYVRSSILTSPLNFTLALFC